ncbi:MAG: filamentous hemagglutinin N-terminal domain-containing protein, partial [Guyparkeria sp.]
MTYPTSAPELPSIRPLVALIACLLAAPPLAASDIRSHPDAPGDKQPVIRESANGTPVIDIGTPGKDGVSHNVYRKLDVDGNGAVFNNGRQGSTTALAGQIGANPSLAGGTAELILNEVRSASPSELAGYLEIGGDPADLVVANPAGITCNGCGFINAERAMLTTGRPTFEGDRWTGLDVRGGRIRIEGDGMDASRTAQADLLARAVEINAGIWADRLDVTTGTGRFDRDGALVEST